ncbi:MAG: hypothetical protein AB8B55_15980 [Mariniblastus sp.]
MKIPLILFCSSLLALSLLSNAQAQNTVTADPVPDLFVTPDATNPEFGTVRDSSGNLVYTASTTNDEYPLVWAIENSATHGNHIRLAAGVYAPFRFDFQATQRGRVSTMQSSSTDRLILEGADGAIIQGNDFGDTVFVLGKDPSHPFNWITWKNLYIEGSGRSAFLIGAGASDLIDGISYTGWHFYDCEVDGMYDHKNGTGRASKWGLLTWAVGKFVWKGGSIHGIKREHAFYFHNNTGNLTINGGKFYEVGRTGIQITARVTDGNVTNLPANFGRIAILNCFFADTGLESGDYHAGSSITITGRNLGEILVKRNRIEFGLDTFTPGLRQAILAMPDYPIGVPYGSGAMVTWAENQEVNGPLTVLNNIVKYEQDSGDRVSLSLSGVLSLDARSNQIINGARATAIEVGRVNNPTHPTPLGYCIEKNRLLRQNGGVSELLINGVGPLPQPQVLNW